MTLPAFLVAVAMNLVYPAQTNLSVSPVTVSFEQSGENLNAKFEVRTATEYSKDVLGPKEYPFQFDVVELFVSVEGNENNLPYYEFELTPKGQTFEVKIIDPKTNRIDGVDMGVDYNVERIRGGWIGYMSIPLKNLGWKGDRKTIIGNAFAVLGKKPNRTFWSLHLPRQKKPNFHRPEAFKPLFLE